MVEFSSHFDLADLINNSVVRLNKIGLTGHPCFMPPFTGIGSISSSFRILTMVEVQMSFIKLIRDCENHMCSRLLQIPSCEILPNVLRRSNHAFVLFYRRIRNLYILAFILFHNSVILFSKFRNFMLSLSTSDKKDYTIFLFDI